jgi:hypothetical protein
MPSRIIIPTWRHVLRRQMSAHCYGFLNRAFSALHCQDSWHGDSPSKADGCHRFRHAKQGAARRASRCVHLPGVQKPAVALLARVSGHELKGLTARP